MHTNFLYIYVCVFVFLLSAVNLLNWSYQSAKACTVLVGENTEAFPKTSAETNCSSGRPPSGGKYLHADGNSVLLPPYSSSSLQNSTLDPKHLRWRRSVNQHAIYPNVDTHGTNSDTPVAARDVVDDDDVDDVDVAVHVDNLTSVNLVHGNVSGSTADVAVTDEGGNLTSEGDISVIHSHQHASVSVARNVSVPKSNYTNSNGNVDEGLIEEEGSGFITSRRNVTNVHDSAADSIQRDYPPVYSYGQDEVEIVRLDHESVTLKSGGSSLPQHTSPDANRLNNELKDVPLIDGESVDDEDVVDKTDRAENERDITGKPVISTVHLSAFQSDATTAQYKDESKPDVSVFRTSLENPSQSNRVETDVGNAATEYNPQSVAEHVPREHGSQLILHSAPDSVPNSHIEVSHNIMNVSVSDVSLTALPKVNVLELSPDINGSSRHAKRVLVNVTIATEDVDQSNETGHHSSNHQPVYVLSVSVPTNGDSEQVAGVDISPPSQKLASVLLGMSNDNATHISVPKHEPPSSLPPATTTVIPFPTTTAFPLWGGVCECTCPCLDNSENETGLDLEGDNTEPVSTDVSVFAENVTVSTTHQGNLTGHETENDDKTLIHENVTVREESSITAEIQMRDMDENSTASSDIPTTTIPTEMTETTTLETSTTPNFTYSTPFEYTDESSNADGLISSSASPLMETVSSTHVSDVVTEMSTDLTGTDSRRQDCPVAPTVTAPPPLILVMEGKTTLQLMSVLHYCHISSWKSELHMTAY